MKRENVFVFLWAKSILFKEEKIEAYYFNYEPLRTYFLKFLFKISISVSCHQKIQFEH